MHPFHRTELLVGADGFDALAAAHFCVVGLGGVGAQAAESLARCGVGHLTLVEFDKVCVTNVNRQVHATRKTVGDAKVELMAARISAIHPKCDVRALPWFYEASTSETILDRPFTWILDCIDNMTAKLHLLETARRAERPIVSAMGAGGRLDPLRVRVDPLSATAGDPFARIVREQLRARGVPLDIPVVWTDELPNDLDPDAKASFRCICPGKDENTKHSCEKRFQVQGSVSFVPGVFGMVMAGYVVNSVLGRPIGRPEPKPRRMAPSRRAAAPS